MQPIHKRVLFGAIAAGFAALGALDATLFAPAEYPLAHKLLGADWIILRNMMVTIATVGAALFGYLALNVKNGNGAP